MERSNTFLVEQVVKNPESIEVVTQLDKLHPRKRTNSLFRENTPVEIHAHPLADGTEYSVLIGKPLRSNDLEQVLKSSSDLPYRTDFAIDYFLSAGEDEFGGGVKSNLEILGKLLEAPDDTNFLTELSGRIKTHDQAWYDLVSQRGYAARLSDQYSNASNSELFETAKRIIDIMRSHPELWTERQRSEGQTRSETLIERFGKLATPQRGRILEEEMKRFEDITTEQKNRIAITNGIRFESNVDGKVWYLTGAGGDVQKINENLYEVVSGQNKARIRPGSEGFEIFPRSAFLLPTLTWSNENGKRKLVIPSKFKKENMVVPALNNREVRFSYPIDPRQLSNPVVGLLTLQYILDFPTFKDFPPEEVPELAALRKSEILQSDFIKNAEALTR